MRFEAFEARAWQDWERVPAEYKTGIDGLLIERDARAHPDLEEIYTLGECITESFPSEYSGPETTRSNIVLYYGSFLRLSMLDRDDDGDVDLQDFVRDGEAPPLDVRTAEMRSPRPLL